MDQRNQTKSAETDPYIYNPLIFNKDAKAIQRGKNSLFNKWFWDNWIFHAKASSWTHHKQNSKWIERTELDWSPADIKLSEET